MNIGTFFFWLYVFEGPILSKYCQVLSDNSPGRIMYGSNLDYCIAIEMDGKKLRKKKKLRKIPGYNGKRLVAACPICHSISCTQNRQPSSYNLMPIKQEKNKWFPISEIIGIVGR